MRNKNEILPQTKSYTGISDIFGSTPFNNVLYRKPYKPNNDQSVAAVTITESDKKSLKNSILFNDTPYVTCEKFHGLNKNLSQKSIVRSTSTIFCDLDDIAKRHSFHCLTEVSMSNANILKVMKLPANKNGFKGKSNPIIQKCATQIHPKLLAKDSMEINTKKAKKFLQNDVLSSEIFLRDSNYGKHCRRNQYYNTDVINNQQKFWSYAKYRTEYTKPIPEEKKKKKKDQGKRTEDPCPCQLFSYACPCTDEKSLTELAKNSKCLTVADQITSTIQLPHDNRKKKQQVVQREDKPTNTNVIVKSEIVTTKNEPIVQKPEKKDIPVLVDINPLKNNIKSKVHTHKKPRQVICPNCKENVDVFSTTEEEECLKIDNSSIYGSKEIMASYNCKTPSNGNRYKTVDDGDSCTHEPRCEMVPVCQILPTEDIFSPKTSKKRSPTKPNAKVIRITKACRHHPPCTVVPSCQRANVLRNNCEFIPPCLHRPRCVNLPLCVPFSKSIYYDDCKPDEAENPEYCHASTYKFIPECQHDSLKNNLDQNYNITRVQNACDFVNGYRTSAFLMNPKTTIMSSMSPCQISTSPCCSCRSNKSCQYECSECKRFEANMLKGSVSSDAIIFIRDVGCQFQSKTYSPKDSIQSKLSSASFDLNVKAGNYYTTVHTLRYEDKFTNPKPGIESTSIDSYMSMAVDSNCPSHGRRSRNRSGFNPTQRYVTAFVKSDKTCVSEKRKDLSKSDVTRHRDSTFPVKSRRSFLKGKYRKVFAAKRRRKSMTNSHIFTNSS